MNVPHAEWLVRLAGVHWYMCVINMVLLAMPMLAALLFGLRYGAPTRPVLAGAMAGLLSGALSATLYISHCPDDSPIFVAAWFTLAIAISCRHRRAGRRPSIALVDDVTAADMAAAGGARSWSLLRRLRG